MSLLSDVAFSQPKAKALQKINKQYFKGKNEEIYTFVAKDALAADVYSISQTFALHSPDCDLAISLLDKWSATGNPEEKVWFIARFILYKLASERPGDATLIFNHYSATGGFNQAKGLQKLLQYLLKSIDLKAGDVFQAVQGKFAPFVQKDQEFGYLLDLIAQNYFGIVKQRQPNMLEMMSRMMGM